MEKQDLSNMPVYLSMLRGINVSGQKKVPMAELKALYEELKFKNVSTYIQSGNVIFEAAKEDPGKLAAKIEKKIASHFKFEVRVIIRQRKELEAILKENPFIKEKEIDPARLYVTFLEEHPDKELSDKLSAVSFDPDRFIIAEKEIYLHCPVAYGSSKLSNNFFEKKLKVTGTTRNWRSVNELCRLMED